MISWSDLSSDTPFKLFEEVRSTWNGRNELQPLSALNCTSQASAFRENDVCLLSGTRRVIFLLQRGYPRGTPAPMWATCRSGLEGQIFHSNNKDPIRSIKTRTPLEVEGLPKMIPTGHVRYIKILTLFTYLAWLPGLGSKLQIFHYSIMSTNSQKRIKHKENQTKYVKMTRKPRIHVRILIYRTWALG